MQNDLFVDIERRVNPAIDIEELYGDLVPHVYKYGNGEIARSDKKAVDMRPLWKAVSDAATDADREKAKQAIRDAELLYIMYIRTYPSLEALIRSMSPYMPRGYVFTHGMSLNILRLIAGRYSHIQVRPGRVGRDTYAFILKELTTPAAPAFLELIDQRVTGSSRYGNRSDT